MAWTPVPNATADEALLVLETLVRAHGPPLVLKCDNGSAFSGHRRRETSDRILGGPPGRYLDWSADNLYAAQQWAKEDHYPQGRTQGTPAELLAARRANRPGRLSAAR